MHVTLVNPPQVFSRFQIAAGITPPLGVAYLAAWLRENGHDVAVVDALGEAPDQVHDFRKQTLLRGLNIAQTVARVGQTDLVGISSLFTSGWPLVADLAAAVRARLPAVPIVVGGPHPSALWEECLAHPAVDYVVVGEGEVPLQRLCDDLERGGDGAVAAVARLENEAAVLVPPDKESVVRDLDTMPLPARDLLPMEGYLDTREAHGPTNDRWTSLLSSRGCPWGCTFCESRLTKWRARSAGNVVDEIEHCVTTWGVRDFHFEDDNMTISTKRVLEIAGELKRRNLTIAWQTPNGIRASVTDRATLQAMRDSGCWHVTLAPESGSPRVLQDIVQKGKDFDLDHLLRVARDAHELGMKVAAYFILGLPGERAEDVDQTIEYACELAKVGVDEVAFALFIPLPGTPLWDVADRGDLDYLDLLTVDDADRAFSFNREMTDDELASHRRRAYLRFFAARARHHPRAFARTLANVLRSRQETKTERAVLSVIDRIRGGTVRPTRPVLAYPYDAARAVAVLLDRQAHYAWRHSLRRALRFLR